MEEAPRMPFGLVLSLVNDDLRTYVCSNACSSCPKSEWEFAKERDARSLDRSRTSTIRPRSTLTDVQVMTAMLVVLRPLHPRFQLRQHQSLRQLQRVSSRVPV